jgi:hypothetical protein
VLLAMTERAVESVRELRDHQHVKDNDRRQAQDHRPDAERPEDVLGPKALLFRNRIFRGIHDAPALFVLSGTLIRAEF